MSIKLIVGLLIFLVYGLGFWWLIVWVKRSCPLCAGDIDRTSGVCRECGFDPRAEHHARTTPGPTRTAGK